MSTTTPMTYAELAEALGRSEIAVRSLARRERWRRIPGNDGRIRIAVPVDHLDALRERSVHRAAAASADTPADAPTSPPAGAPVDRVVEMLEARVAELQAEARQDRATITALTARASRADTLEALLDAAQRDRDRWHAEATARRSWWPWRRSA